ncbi:MAG: hypothetical protein J5965_14430 [Aeriscardovia sp.]|nr:hypothetical protein [Aeriscardovia sp.]
MEQKKVSKKKLYEMRLQHNAESIKNMLLDKGGPQYDNSISLADNLRKVQEYYHGIKPSTLEEITAVFNRHL